MNDVNPLAVINPDQTVVSIDDQAKQSYDNGVQTRNKNALVDVYKNNPDSEIAKAALQATNTIAQGEEKFKDIVGPIEKAGGVGTPEGNIAAAKQYESMKDHPQWGSALVAYLMGQKDQAYNLATGGREKSAIEWGKDGGQYVRVTNGLGETVSVTDVNGNKLTPGQVQDLGIGYSSYENTQKSKLELENKQARLAQSQFDTKVSNDWANATDTHARQAASVIPGLQQIKSQIPLADYQRIMGLVNSGSTITSGGSTQNQAIGTKSKNVSTGEEKNAGINAEGNIGVGKLGGAEQGKGGGSIGVSGGGKAGASTSSKESVSGQQQNIAGTSTRAEQEATLAKNKESMLAEAQLRGVKNPEQLAILSRAFDVAAQIKMDQDRLLTKYEGQKPSFVSIVSATKLGDQQSQLEAQLLQTLHNNEQLQAYRQFYNSAMKGYKATSTTPDFGEIESKFVSSSPAHEQIANKYATLIGSMMDRNAKASEQNVPVANPAAGAPPPAARVVNTSRTAPVAPPRPSLDDLRQMYLRQQRMR